jgi:cytosine deaminase
VLLQARDPIEAIRLRANRLKVWRKGKVVAETAEVVTRLGLPGRASGVKFQ